MAVVAGASASCDGEAELLPASATGQLLRSQTCYLSDSTYETATPVPGALRLKRNSRRDDILCGGCCSVCVSVLQRTYFPSIEKA